jgi:hypothetical protein
VVKFSYSFYRFERILLTRASNFSASSSLPICLQSDYGDVHFTIATKNFWIKEDLEAG